jgi:predicted MFS family arabinose efflux permease
MSAMSTGSLTRTHPAGPTAVSADRPRARHLSDWAAFYLQASIVVSFLAGSSAPTPLYGVYQHEWGFSPIMTTVVFGVYAIAVLAALLVFGSLSDYVGRRPVLLVAIAVQAVTMLVFATAPGVGELLLARVLQGLSTGAAVGALGAGMIDVDRVRGTTANAVAPMTGTATGALVSGLVVEFLPAPTRLIYAGLLAVFVVQFVGVIALRETVGRKAGARASLIPRLGVPATARRPFLVAVPVLVAVWALAGFYGSLGPGLARIVVGSNAIAVGGLALFAIAATGGLTVLITREFPARPVMALGAMALVVGVGLTVVAVDTTSAVWFFVGAAVSGIGFGAGFQGAVRTVIPLAQPHERAGLLSAVFAVSYLAMGAPAVVAGWLVVHSGGTLASTAREYGFALMALAVASLVGLAARSSSDRSAY